MEMSARIAQFETRIATTVAKRDSLDDGPKKDRVVMRLGRMNARLAKMQNKLATINS